MNSTNVRGSEWRKWNLHVHTKGTNKNDQFSSITKEDFFYTFFSEAYKNAIEAIGITDYFSIDCYNDAIEYQNKIETIYDSNGNRLFSDEAITFLKSIFIFPNVELRMLPSTEKGKLINIHCLFNPEYVSELENDFFSHIENQDKIKMNRHGMVSYGKQLDPSILDEKMQYKKGIDNFVIDLKSLVTLLETNRKFKDNTLIVVSNSSADGASGTQKHYDLFENEEGSLDGLRKSIYCASDAIFSATPKDIKYFLGKRLEGTDNYSEAIYKKEVQDIIRLRGSLKPCIQGCDAHKEDELFTRFTWIKADLNFEGLRQICYEPEQRVKIQKEKPDFKEDKLLIDKVQFISPNPIFSNKPLYLNPNLNVIIGGKSSGKSILLYSIAKTLLSDMEVLKKIDETFIYDLDMIDKDFDFEITTKGGFTQRLNRPVEINSILPEIKYIPQSYLVKLAEPELNKKGKSLNKLVRDLITENPEADEKYKNFIFKVKQNDRTRNLKIDSYFEITDEIETLEKELKTKSTKDVLEENIKNNLNRVEELSLGIGFSSEEINKYKFLQDEVEQNNMDRRKLREDLKEVQNFNTELLQVFNNLIQKKNDFIGNIQTAEIKEFYLSAFSKLDNTLSDLLEVISHSEINTTDGIREFKNPNSVFFAMASKYTVKKDVLTQGIAPYLQNEQIKKAIEDLNLSIADDRKSLSDIDNLTKKIAERKKHIEECKEELFKMYEANHNEYTLIISDLKPRVKELEKDGLDIIGIAQFNYPKLRKMLIEITDGRRNQSYSNEILNSKRKATDFREFGDILNDLKILFEDIIKKDLFCLIRHLKLVPLKQF